MNVFNRIVMVIGILIWIGILALLMAVPWEVTAVVSTGAAYVGDAIYNNTFYYTLIGSCAGAIFLLLILLWLELRRPRRRLVRIQSSGAGRASLGVESIQQSLEYRIDELAGVRDVKTTIRSRGRDVDVAVDLNTSPSVNLPVLTAQISDLAHDIIEGQLGVKIHGKVDINVKHEPYPRGTMPPTSPLEGTQAARPTVAEEQPPKTMPPAQPVETPNRVREARTAAAGAWPRRAFW